MPRLRVLRRLAIGALGALTVLLVTAGPAAAHVEATVSDGAQAGGDPITVTFSAEAERDAAGIAGIQVQLPASIVPEWVSLDTAPPGWALTLTADGYEIGEEHPSVHASDAIFEALGTVPPDMTTIVFKTLVNYTDGSQDAWIEEPTADNPDPANPAPSITVAPAAATSAPATTSSSAAATTAAPTTTPAVADDTGSDSSGSGVARWLTIGVLVVAVVGGGLWFWRSRTARRAS